MSADDRTILRDLVKQYVELCQQPVQQERRRLWRALNSKQPTRPLIYIRAYAAGEVPEVTTLRCQDAFWRGYEHHLRDRLYHARFDDDSIYAPWLTVGAARWAPPHGLWGVPTPFHRPQAGGAGVWDPPLKTEADLAKLAHPKHEVDEAATARTLARVQDAVGDLIALEVDRAPLYRAWGADLSTHLGYLRGIGPLMLDMMDRPAWLHRVLAHMRDGILRTHQQAEAAGHWRLSQHENQAMPYAAELEDPAANSAPVPRRRLWWFCASQELAQVGPRQFDEFMFQYQMPICREFALVAYGCCEDLTHKIGVLRQLPNLRRIAVSPMANVAKCAAQIGGDYVISYRPSPADMVSYRFDEARVRTILRRDFAALRAHGCLFDVTLKDVETVEREPQRVRRFVEITREEIARLG